MIQAPAKKAGTELRRISLFAIAERDNVRKVYPEESIIELARSIEQNGLEQPIKVYRDDEADEYVVVHGHRRRRAFLFLHVTEKKDFYNEIECIVSSKPEFQELRIKQLIENEQREDMTAAEREGAIQDLKGTGLLNRDIARRIGKPESWVSSILTADTERKHLDEMGIDTTPLSSHAVAQIARVPEEKRIEAAKETIERGGTARAAEQVRRESNDAADDYASTLDRVKLFLSGHRKKGLCVSYVYISDNEIRLVASPKC